jgi:hypothetical protein
MSFTETRVNPQFMDEIYFLPCKIGHTLIRPYILIGVKLFNTFVKHLNI